MSDNQSLNCYDPCAIVVSKFYYLGLLYCSCTASGVLLSHDCQGHTHYN